MGPAHPSHIEAEAFQDQEAITEDAQEPTTKPAAAQPSPNAQPMRNSGMAKKEAPLTKKTSTERILTAMDPQQIVEPTRQVSLQREARSRAVERQTKRDKKALIRALQRETKDRQFVKTKQPSSNYKRLGGNRRPHRPSVE